VKFPFQLLNTELLFLNDALKLGLSFIALSGLVGYIPEVLVYQILEGSSIVPK
jgi:hypothetical protein